MDDRLQRTLTYFQQLATFVKKANEMTTLLARLDAESQLAPMDQTTTRTINEQRKAMRELHELATTKAVEKSKRDDFDAAESLVQSIEARLANADEIKKGVEAYAAQLELGLTLGEFTADERSQAESQLSELRRRYEVQLDLAYALVPAESTLLAL